MEGLALDTIQTDLKAKGVATFSFAGFEIEAEEGEGKLRLRTAVFHGGDYIPPSVRRCLGGRRSLIAHDPQTEIELWIDQEKFRVVLDYRVERAVSAVFEEFIGVADEWRTLLDEYGQQDLIYVPVK
ncbi:MAG: hypothetical protein AB7F31_02120 [Parachlamydiales bacterium]